MGWLSLHQISELGFAAVGRNVRLSDKASYYNCGRVQFGDNVRIDDFCVISAGNGGIVVGSHVHIAVYTCLIGAGRIEVGDFSNLSSRVAIYSSNDDYSGARLTNPTVPPELSGVVHNPVTLGRHVIIGSGTVVLPGVTLGDGVAVGALSLVKQDLAPFTIHAGVPAHYIGERKRDLLELEQRMPRTTA